MPFPQIITSFDKDFDAASSYSKSIERILFALFPQGIENAENLHRELPLVTHTSWKSPPCHLSFFLFCRFRNNAFSFFYEMLSRWLVPGRRFNASLQFAADFFFAGFSEHPFLIGEVVLHIENGRDYKILQSNWPSIETEIRFGIESTYQAHRILEIKGLNADEKTAFIQENIASLVKHRPQDFDYDVFSEMQHFLVLCKPSFKAARCFRHMSRIICVHYLFRRALKYSLEAFPDQRLISVKVATATLALHGERKNVLGIMIGLSFLRKDERCEEHHILNALRLFIPDATLVEGSFFVNASRSDPTCMLYLEIEKESGLPFILAEKRLLKQELPETLKQCIEQRQHHIFMPQNEEEILRNILTLGQQLRWVKDLPQVILSFERQTESALEFLVFVGRIAHPEAHSIAELCESKPSFLRFFPDRVKNIGVIRKKYNKEITVFRVQVKKMHYLRHDHSVDLGKTRQEISEELRRMIGEFRDYNGGILSKESELFSSLRLILGKAGREQPFLLDNFFYAISPPLMRSILPPEPLKKLFLLFRRAIKDSSRLFFEIEEEEGYFYLLLGSADGRLKKRFLFALEGLKIPSSHQALSTLEANGLPLLGVIIRPTPQISPLQINIAFSDFLKN